MEKKNNWLITVLVILVLCLGGYIVYDKVISKEQIKIEETENNKKEDNDIKNDNNLIEESSINLENTIFKAVNKDNFKEAKIYKLCNEESNENYGRYYDKVVTISNWNKITPLLIQLTKQTYTEFETTGVGFSDYQIEIIYEDKKITIQKEMVFGDAGMYLISTSEDNETKLIQLVDTLYSNN